MPDVIQVRACNGDFYCKPDPKDHSIIVEGKEIWWHCNQHEFEITFNGENPFDDTPNRTIQSEDRWIKKEVTRNEGKRTVYAYTVGPINSPNEELKDPGLIVRP